MRFIALFVLLLIAIGAFFVIWQNRLPDMAANHLSKKLQVAVSIDAIDLSSSEITIKNIEIGNPHGYHLPRAFSAETITLFAPLSRYLSKHLLIEEIVVDNIYLGLEFNSPQTTEGNWTKMLSHFEKSAHLDRKGPKQPSALIKKIVFTNIQTDLVFLNKATTQNLKVIDRIELTNISTEGGFPLDQVMGSILGQMVKEIYIRENIKAFLEIIKPSDESWDSFTKPFKDLFNALPSRKNKNTA